MDVIAEISGAREPRRRKIIGCRPLRPFLADQSTKTADGPARPARPARHNQLLQEYTKAIKELALETQRNDSFSLEKISRTDRNRIGAVRGSL